MGVCHLELKLSSCSKDHEILRHPILIIIPYSQKIWQFDGLRQIKIRQNFLLAYIRMDDPVPNRLI